MVMRKTLTPTLDGVVRDLMAEATKGGTRPFGTKVIGEGEGLEMYDAATGALAVRISPDGSYFTGTVEVRATDGSTIKGYNAAGDLTLDLNGTSNYFRGTVEVRSSGASTIKGYNDSGDLTLDLNGTNNLIVGKLRTAPMGEHQIVLQADSTSNLGMWFSFDGGTPGFGSSFSWAPGMWVPRTPDFFTPAYLNLRGQRNAGVRVHGELSVSPTSAAADNHGEIYAPGMTPLHLTGGALHQTALNGRITLNPVLTVRFLTRDGPGGYEWTVGSAANMHITADGLIFRSTSATRYKTDIAEYVPDDAYLDIPVVSWRDKAALAAAADITDETPRPLTLEQQMVVDRAQLIHVGTRAEDAENVSPHQIVRNQAGEIDGYAYDRDGSILRYFVRGHRDRIAALERAVFGPTEGN